jgi:putative RecB family exonuclease
MYGGGAMSVFSHSRIQAFETCPKKYEFSYVLKAPKGPAGIEAFTGSRIHEALEWLYEQVRLCRLPDEEDAVAVYVRAWDDAWSDDVRITRADRTTDDYRAIGEKAVRDYFRRYHPFDQGVTVGLEMKIDLRLDDDHQIAGYVDRLTKVSDGVWEIHDYKSGGSLMTQDKADADRQLALYELAVREMYPDAREVSLVWHYLAFDHEVRSCRSPQQLEELRAQVLESVLHIEAQKDFPTRTSSLCDWCDYKAICPAWRHEAELAGLPPERLAGEPRVALVDRYVAVSAEIAVLTNEKDDLADEIVRRADEDGLDQVFGTDHALKVFRFSGVGLPGKDEPGREEVESILREAGLWDRFSNLASVSLSKALESGALAPETAKRLAPYLSQRSGAKLYSRKRS